MRLEHRYLYSILYRNIIIMKEYVFCDQCLEDITNKCKVQHEDNVFFCSKICHKDYIWEQGMIAYMMKIDKCWMCNKEICNGQLIHYKIDEVYVCSEECQVKYLCN